MKNRWFLIAVLFPLLSFSQQKGSKGLVTVVSVGFAAGESTAKPLVQASGGKLFDKWFTGIGTGYDGYRFGSMALFADARYFVDKGKLGFIYANPGYNFPLRRQGSDNQAFKTADELTGGLYFDAGIGYRLKVNSLHRVLFSAGYSRKLMTNKVVYVFPCLTGNCPEEANLYKYDFGRIVMKLGWEFGK